MAGNGEFDFNLTNPGELSPGVDACSPGSFAINGNYVQEAGGQLQIKIGGFEPGVDHDMLIVNGEATLSGALNISAINDFQPQPGQEFEIITANAILGQFDSIGGSGEYETTYENNRVVLTVLTDPTEVAARCIDADSDATDTDDGTFPSVNLCGAGFVPAIGLTMLGLGLVRRHRRWIQ